MVTVIRVSAVQTSDKSNLTYISFSGYISLKIVKQRNGHCKTYRDTVNGVILDRV